MPAAFEAIRVSEAALPTIDAAGLNSAKLSERRAVAGRVRQACLHNGFFYLTNHGIPASIIETVFAETKRFFALPMAAKLALDKAHSRANRGYEKLRGQTLEAGAQPDLKEGFYIGPEIAADDPRAAKFNHGPNQWPVGLPTFRATMEAYREMLTDLGGGGWFALSPSRSTCLRTISRRSPRARWSRCACCTIRRSRRMPPRTRAAPARIPISAG
jgi:isopenicillin N synthase-like dioxygenase